ncbi:hypothetical protein BGZ96_008009 [Linnemannia gamsii]|uniref:F-box domain-containing protein n=1 Tax=Linnemannia gamsii TaxID=64522 RepID=A0ABQ7KF70_9FUNG|nr:hypothetical protein BGZ96_008009 [Linnemannia gamsii]
MSSAGTHFFSIAELTVMVTAYLNKPNTFALAQTNRRLFELCEPSLFTSLRLDYNPHRAILFESSQATLSLARNAHFVKSLRISVVNLAMLTDCMFAYLDSTVDDKQEPRLDSLPSPCFNSTVSSSSLSHIIPVPPMSNLERLETTLTPASNVSTCSYYLETGNNPQTTLLQYCRLLDLSPHLTYLKVGWISISTTYGLRILATSLSTLLCLETLILDNVIANDDAWSCIGRTLFNSCSSSLRTFASRMGRPFTQSRFRNAFTDNWSDVQQELQELEGAPPATRKAIQDLTMWAIGDNRASRNELSAMLQRCPNLIRLAIPGTQFIPEYITLVQLLVSHCPKVTSVAFLDYRNRCGNHHSLTPLLFMQSMPAHRIEEFKWTHFFECLTRGRARIFRRHSEVLRKIVIEGGTQVQSSAIRSILTHCPVLENLQIKTDIKDIYSSTILLSYALTEPWVCTKLQVLDLAIVIPKMPVLKPGQGPIYERPMYRSFTNEEAAPYDEAAQYEEYKKLYQQIGLLTSLTHLALRAVLDDSISYRDRRHYDFTLPFPGMMNLCLDNHCQRPGYLDLLGGLTRLEELRGSVYTNNEETQMTMGWKEARWMAQHWPELRVAAFANKVEELREPFLWLQKELELVIDSDPLFQWE